MTIIESIAENKLRLTIGNFLSKIIYENKYIMIDIWAFMHLLFGGIIMLILNLFKLNAKKRYLILISILVGYEVLEFFLYTTFTTIFIPETFGNVIFDIVLGLVGAGIVDLIFLVRKK